MRKIVSKYALVAALMIPVLAMANGKPTSTARKDYNKSYAISQGTTLELETSFAEITIVNWDKNEISISGFVEVEARSQEKAQKMVDNTQVKMSQNGSVVTLEIELGNNNMSGGKDKIGSSEHEIDFTINAPSWVNLDANISFGSLDVPRAEGSTHIDISYSELNIDHITDKDADVSLSFGSGDIGHFGGGNLDVSFSEMNVDHLDNNADLDTSYGETTIHAISKDVMEIDIDNSFGECNINVSAGQTYVVDSESSFGDVDFHGNWEIIRSDKEFNSKEVKGYFGGGNNVSNRRIDIDNSFGSVNLYSK